MAGEAEVSVELGYAFGSLCGSAVRDAVLFADDVGQQITYPVGRQVAICHLENSEASFVSGDRVEQITACAVSSDRSFLAVCEKSAAEARISVYDLRSGGSRPIKTLKPLSGAAPSARLLALSFSGVPQEGGTARYLCATSSGSEATVLVMNWEAEKVLSRMKVPGAVDRVAFPIGSEATEISVSGPHLLRLMQLRASKGEASLKVMPVFSGLDERQVRILDHTWLESSRGLLAACVYEGPVYLLSAEELLVVRTLANPFGAEGTERGDVVPYCIRSFSQGFLLGGAEAHIAVWELADDDAYMSVDGSQQGSEGGAQATESRNFKHSNTVRVRQLDAAISSLDLTGGEESILLGFRDADMGVLSMGSLYATDDEQVSCNVVCGGNHSGGISGLDMAVQRPVLASVCNKDGTVRVWNYATRQCAITSYFATDPPVSVALHPFGYYAAVSFHEKLRFFHILVKDLKLHCEVPVRGVTHLKFAFGGHVLAAAQGKVIQIFSVRTNTKVTTLQGHTKDICGLSFDPEDHSLWSISEDGRLIEWETRTWSLVSQNFEQGLEFLAVSATAPRQATCSVSRGSKFFVQWYSLGELQEEHELAGSSKLRSVCTFPSNPAVFAGTDQGDLRLYGSLQEKGPAKYTEFGLHALGACKFLCLSADGRTMVTAGEDGALFLLNVAGLSSGEEAPGVAVGQENADKLSSESEAVLASKSEIQRLESTCQALTDEHKALKERIVEEASKLEDECANKVAEARQKDQVEIQELLRRITALEQASEAKERESQRIMRAMEASHCEAADQLGNLYDRKISHESDRLLALQMKRNMLEKQMQQEEKVHQERLEQSKNAAKEDLETALAERDLDLKKHQDLLAFVQHRFEVFLDKQSEEHDLEVTRLEQQGREALEEQTKVEVQLRREQETLLRGLEMQEKDREQVEDKQQEAAQAVKSLREQAEELKRTLHSLTSEREDRELTLADKERRISSYKLKEKTLKKFKLVLDQKLAEVTQSLQPKDHLINQLNQDLQELQNEFERQLTDQRALEGQIDQRQQQAAILTKETEELRERIKEKDTSIFRFKNELNNLVTKQKDLKLWPKEIRKLYHTHVCDDQRTQERLPLEEMQRQMRIVERKVTSLAAKGNQSRATCKLDIQRKANENATLVHELNQLRVQKKQLQAQVRSLQQKLKGLDGGGGKQKASIEDSTQQPSPHSPSNSVRSGAGSSTSPLPLPPRPPSASTGNIRQPTGSLPGPRQRSSSREQLLQPEGTRNRGVTALDPLRGHP